MLLHGVVNGFVVCIIIFHMMEAAAGGEQWTLNSTWVLFSFSFRVPNLLELMDELSLCYV